MLLHSSFLSIILTNTSLFLLKQLVYSFLFSIQPHKTRTSPSLTKSAWKFWGCVIKHSNRQMLDWHELARGRRCDRLRSAKSSTWHGFFRQAKYIWQVSTENNCSVKVVTYRFHMLLIVKLNNFEKITNTIVFLLKQLEYICSQFLWSES